MADGSVTAHQHTDFAKPANLKNVPDFQDIHISNIVCRGCTTGIKAKGTEAAQCVHDIEITNATIIYNKVATDIDTATTQIKLTDVKLVENKLAD